MIQFLFVSLERDNCWHSDATELLQEIAKDHPGMVIIHFCEWAIRSAASGNLLPLPLRSVLGALPEAVVKTAFLDLSPDAAAALSYHLPVPILLETGNTSVPFPTLRLLERHAESERVFQSFLQGSLSRNYHDPSDEFGRTMSTDVHGALRWLEQAKALQSHDLEPIRRWHETLTNFFQGLRSHLDDSSNERAEALYRL